MHALAPLPAHDPSSARRLRLQEAAADLRALDGTLDDAGARERLHAIADIDDAARALDATATDVVRAGGHVLGAGWNATAAGAFTVASAAHASAAAGLSTAAAAAAAADEGRDLIGALAQMLGRSFLRAGNEARAVADVGGVQQAVVRVPGDPSAPSWSDALLAAADAEGEAAVAAGVRGAVHLAGAVGNGALGALDLARAGSHGAQAGGEVVAAFGHAVDALALEGAERAVELAGAGLSMADDVVAAAELAVDAAGARLQDAGRALVTAGNAVNTTRAIDTAVQ